MVMQSQTITKVSISGKGTLAFMKENLAQLIQLEPKVSLVDYFHGFGIFLHFKGDTYLQVMQEKGLLPKNMKLHNFHCKPDGAIELELVPSETPQ